MDVLVCCHGQLLTPMETFRSPFSVSFPCDSSRSYAEYGGEDEEVVQFEGALVAVKDEKKAF